MDYNINGKIQGHGPPREPAPRGVLRHDAGLDGAGYVYVYVCIYIYIRIYIYIYRCEHHDSIIGAIMGGA